MITLPRDYPITTMDVELGKVVDYADADELAVAKFTHGLGAHPQDSRSLHLHLSAESSYDSLLDEGVTGRYEAAENKATVFLGTLIEAGRQENRNNTASQTADRIMSRVIGSMASVAMAHELAHAASASIRGPETIEAESEAHARRRVALRRIPAVLGSAAYVGVSAALAAAGPVFDMHPWEFLGAGIAGAAAGVAIGVQRWRETDARVRSSHATYYSRQEEQRARAAEQAYDQDLWAGKAPQLVAIRLKPGIVS